MRHLITTSRRLAAPALAALAVGACSGESADDRDPYAGLNEAIQQWRVDLVASDACPAPPAEALTEGQGGADGCRNFAVACKVEGELTEAEAEQGGAKVLTAMRWEAWNPESAEFRTTSAAANFLKVGETWTRSDAPPVNLTTCRPLDFGQ